MPAKFDCGSHADDKPQGRYEEATADNPADNDIRRCTDRHPNTDLARFGGPLRSP